MWWSHNVNACMVYSVYVRSFWCSLFCMPVSLFVIAFPLNTGRRKAALFGRFAVNVSRFVVNASCRKVALFSRLAVNALATAKAVCSRFAVNALAAAKWRCLTALLRWCRCYTIYDISPVMLRSVNKWNYLSANCRHRHSCCCSCYVLKLETFIFYGAAKILSFALGLTRSTVI